MAGISAAVWCKRLGLSAVLIEREDRIGGQLHQIKNEIWDYPPHVYANGSELLAEVSRYLEILGLDLRLNEALLSVDTLTREVTTSKGGYRCDYLILATGVRPNTLPLLEHSRLALAPWFSTTSQGELLSGTHVLIIGGGDRAVESACNLSAHARHVWLAVRSNRLRARPEWVERLSLCRNVTILWETQLVGTQETGKPCGVYLATNGDRKPRFLPMDWVLPRIGVIANSETVPSLERDEQQYLRVDPFQVTSTDWIYAIGDVTNGAAYAGLALAVGQGMRAAKHISLSIREG